MCTVLYVDVELSRSCSLSAYSAASTLRCCAAAASVILCSLQNEVVDTKMKKMLTELMHDSEFPTEEILFLSEDYFLRLVQHPKFNLKYDVWMR